MFSFSLVAGVTLFTNVLAFPRHYIAVKYIPPVWRLTHTYLEAPYDANIVLLLSFGPCMRHNQVVVFSRTLT